MAFIKIKGFYLKKNKRYNYTPRYYDGKDLGNIYDLETSRICKDRETRGNHFTEEWRDVRIQSRNRSNSGFNKVFFIVLILLLLVVLYIFDFNLSFFLASR